MSRNSKPFSCEYIFTITRALDLFLVLIKVLHWHRQLLSSKKVIFNVRLCTPSWLIKSVKFVVSVLSLNNIIWNVKWFVFISSIAGASFSTIWIEGFHKILVIQVLISLLDPMFIKRLDFFFSYSFFTISSIISIVVLRNLFDIWVAMSHLHIQWVSLIFKDWHLSKL